MLRFFSCLPSLHRACLATLFALLFSHSVCAQQSAPKAARILLVTQSAGFKHSTVDRKESALSHTERVMNELGVSSGLFRVTCTQDAAADLTKEKLQNFDIVMFYTTGDLPITPENLEYFIKDWLTKPRHGFIGVHSAADTYHNYEPYWDMIGGTFDGHPWNADGTVTIANHDLDNPLTRHWGPEVTLKDEIYQFKHWQPEKVRVLMSLDMAKTELKKPYHVPILWIKKYGDGKAMHMSLGHREDVWTNENYQKTLLEGVKWMLGVTEIDATPNPELDKQENEKAKAASPPGA